MKRGDMIRRFETVVQQEIDLHNNEISYIHTRINEISSNITDLQKEFSKKIDVTRSQNSETNSHLSGIKENKDLIDDLSLRINNLEASNASDVKACDQYKEISRNFITLEDVVKLLEDENKKTAGIISICNDKISEISSNHEIFCKEICRRIRELCEMDERCLKRCDELTFQVNALCEMVEHSVINSDWAKKDIQKKQKQLFVLEKKFEYLETLIKRNTGGSRE